jgi:hypothetical protein
MNASILLAIGAGIAATSTSVACVAAVTPHSAGTDAWSVGATGTTA